MSKTINIRKKIQILILVLIISFSVGQIEICNPRNPVRIEHSYLPENPELGEIVIVHAEVVADKGSVYPESAVVPQGKLIFDFKPPYEAYSKTFAGPVGVQAFLLKKRRAKIEFIYKGVDQGACPLQFQEARAATSVYTPWGGAIGWMMDHLIAFSAIFFVLIFYHWFSPNRLDIDTILSDTGLMAILQDFLGAKKRQ
ncbi:MAG: hypothetical protein ABH950_07980 [Candidatus Altiarchaeota archaeon]